MKQESPDLSVGVSIKSSIECDRFRQGWKDAAAALKELPQSYLKPKANRERT